MNDNDVMDRVLNALEWLEEIKGATPSDENYENADIIQKFIKCYQTELHRQIAEIDRLTVELQAMRGAASSYKMHYENAQAKINLLNLKIRDLNKECVELSKEHWNDWEIHCNAIIEFAERLKPKLLSGEHKLDKAIQHNIDTLTKEMTQEGGGADA